MSKKGWKWKPPSWIGRPLARVLLLLALIFLCLQTFWRDPNSIVADEPLSRRIVAVKRPEAPLVTRGSGRFTVRLSTSKQGCGNPAKIIEFNSTERNCEHCFDLCRMRPRPDFIEVDCDTGLCAAVLYSNCKGEYRYENPGYQTVALSGDGCIPLQSTVMHIEFRHLQVHTPTTSRSLGIEANEYDVVLAHLNYWDEVANRGAPKTPTDKYVTFNTDCGGFNNIRMGFEHAILVAWTTGRTLVLPQPRGWYLIDYGPRMREHENTGKGKSDYDEFWSLEALKRAIPVITRDDFERRVDPEVRKTSTEVCKYEAFKDAIMWPSVDEMKRSGRLQSLQQLLGQRGSLELSPKFLASTVLHFPACEFDGGPRFLNQVSGVFLYADRDKEIEMKRFFKNHVRYKDEVFAVAARVVAELGLFNYTALHIRRNDLQYKESHISAADTLRNIKAYVPVGEKIYLATDEVAPGFFADLEAKNQVFRWKDFEKERGNFVLKREAFSLKLVGLIEQVICAGAKRFFGTTHSTFTSHIFRLRGYIGAPDTRMLFHTQRVTGDPSVDDQISEHITGSNYMIEDPSMWTDVDTVRVRS